ncbi:hypothetical protein BOTBODRAFT_36643 [Botryobasidium botryosum FD-172 SS1]|uniref:Uncharacterized protein n=1 Tax=Botryobasidium botryosum (strain FD-172 SS1) TaxID=930990 RepID=A0A067MEL3_BOTB1|nr:hypothetical protein BOTBODRAFT_36643 [Botryobasidium botryosum FD-172 SS1]
MHDVIDCETDTIMQCFPLRLIHAVFSLRSRTTVKRAPRSVRQFVMQAIDAHLDEIIRDWGLTTTSCKP